MSSLHKLKAYFGMVPADEFGADLDADYDGDDYDRDDYERSYDRGRDDARYSRDSYVERPARREPRLVEREPAMAGARSSYDGAEQGGARRTGSRLEPIGASAGRSGSTATRGALAVDPRHDEQRLESHRADSAGDEGGDQKRISTVHPTDYAEAKVVGERFRAGSPVIINLTQMSDADAKRLVDFSAGLAFAMRGSIDKVTTKVFLLSPATVEFTDEDRKRMVADGFYNH